MKEESERARVMIITATPSDYAICAQHSHAHIHTHILSIGQMFHLGVSLLLHPPAATHPSTHAIIIPIVARAPARRFHSKMF